MRKPSPGPQNLLQDFFFLCLSPSFLPSFYASFISSFLSFLLSPFLPPSFPSLPFLPLSTQMLLIIFFFFLAISSVSLFFKLMFFWEVIEENTIIGWPLLYNIELTPVIHRHKSATGIHTSPPLLDYCKKKKIRKYSFTQRQINSNHSEAPTWREMLLDFAVYYFRFFTCKIWI